MLDSIEIKSSFPEQEIKQVKKELKSELDKIDNEEDPIKPVMEKKSIPVPTEVISGLLRLEGAAICAILTKHCPDHIKESAREAIKPSLTEIQVAQDFAQAIFDRYAPKVFEGENAALYLLGSAYLISLGGRVSTIYAIAQTTSSKKSA